MAGYIGSKSSVTLVAESTPSIDDNGNATAITIDSDENVLVGTTSTTPAVSNDSNGIALQENGTVQFSANATTTAIINRKATDGTILQFRKDGTIVGSIGSYTGSGTSQFYISGADTGLKINSTVDVIAPSDASGGTRDNAISFGDGGARFKDLYLGGGVYLGGTGAANKLEDYEEGTWTPTAVSNCSIPTIHNAHYTKIGNKVHLSFWIKTTNTASNIVMAGLPFEVTPNQRFTGAASDVINLNNISNQALYLNIYFYNVPTGSNRDLMFGMSYKTNL